MVNVHLARNYAMVRKGAEDIVNGKILEYEAKTIFQDGWREGYKQGIWVLPHSGQAAGIDALPPHQWQTSSLCL